MNYHIPFKNIFLSLIVFNLSFSAIPEIKWQKDFGSASSADYYDGRCVLETSQNYFVVVGQRTISSKSQLFIAYFDSSGDEKWLKYFGTPVSSYSFISMDTTYDGNILISASYPSSTLLLKVNLNGDSLWSDFLNCDGRSIFLNSDSTYTLFANPLSLIAIKLDKNFDSISSKSVQAEYSITQTKNRGYISTRTRSYVTRLDSSYNVTWDNVYEYNPDQNWFTIAKSIRPSIDSGFILGCYLYIGSFKPKSLWLVRLKEQGDTSWSTRYNPFYSSSSCSTHTLKYAEQILNGDIVLGTILTNKDTSTDVILIGVDSIGDSIWTYRYNKVISWPTTDSLEDFCTNLIRTSDSSFCLLVNSYNYKITNIPKISTIIKFKPYHITTSSFNNISPKDKYFYRFTYDNSKHVLSFISNNIRDNSDISLLSLNGKTIQKWENISYTSFIKINSQLSSGVYFIKVLNKKSLSNLILTYKIILCN